MNNTLRNSFIAILAGGGAVALAVGVASGYSFDTQLNQAKAAISAIAEEGLIRQNSSFDTQLNQAKAAISAIAEEGLKTK